MNAVDTNVLLYMHDPRDARKQQIANDLIRTLPDGIILWQVACEYLAASRKLASVGFTFEMARQNIEDLCGLFPLNLPTWEVIEMASDFTTRHSVSFWDAMILAASQRAGVHTLYSEDIQPRMVPLSMKIINPFTT